MRTTQQFELFLAQLYTDETLLARFVMNPAAELERTELNPVEIAALMKVNAADLQGAAQSFQAKRKKRGGHHI